MGAARIEVSDTAAAQELFWREGWTDGLPIVPPTPALVDSFLAAAGLDPAAVVGEIPERQRRTTAEEVAINAVIAAVGRNTSRLCSRPGAA